MKSIYQNFVLAGITALTVLGSIAADTHEPYRPLIIMGKEGRVLQFIPYFEGNGTSADIACSPFPLPTYVIGKNRAGTIQVSEFVFRRYPGSAAIKNPFFKPDGGFRCVVPTRRRDTAPIHPLMKEFGQFLLTKQAGDNMHYALCTFYADAETIAYHKKSCFEKLVGYFCKQQAPNEHVDHLMNSLRGFEVNSQGLFDAQFSGHDTNDVSSGFAYTNVFIDPAVTLHDLQQLVNPGVQQKGNMFYLENATYFMLFLN